MFISDEDNAVDQFKEIVGAKEFDELISLVAMYAECGDVKCLRELSEKTGLWFWTPKDVLDNLDALRKIELSDGAKNFVNIVITSSKLCKKLVQNKIDNMVEEESLTL